MWGFSSFRGTFGVLLLFFSLNFFAQKFTPAKWTFTYKEINDTLGRLEIKAALEPDWHIYSQAQSGNGPLPTVFRFTTTPEFNLKGDMQEPDPYRIHDDFFDADVAMFSIEVVFTQKVIKNTNVAFTIYGEVEYMACNDQECLPPIVTKFSVKVPAPGP